MRSEFLTNYSETTFLNRIKDNLRTCKSFSFSVSFIKRAGLVLLVKDIESALVRGCEGRLITSTYQNFTDIESLKTFQRLAHDYPNFDCRLDFESFHESKSYTVLGFHTKGYYFEFEDTEELIIGSSNITRYALLKNIEWDLVITETKGHGVCQPMLDEFQNLWIQTEKISDTVIRKYAEHLNYAIERWDMDYDFSQSPIKPNYMQRRALKELNRYRAMGTTKALAVAAAGSGKTYLAAFDALNFSPNKLLYIVHEGSILRKSLDTFKNVFGNTVSYGVYDGKNKETEADFLFSTNITMSQNLDLFSKDEFDYIVVDECHHATAETYRKIINYFTPEFLLGLTATPERMDHEDVFELFDQNVPYELRLRDAIINELVVPFKYYGIRDQLVDYNLNANEERKMIAQLASPDHISFITQEIEKHRKQGGKLKALAFCKSISHARMMAEALAEQHYHTAFLSGKNTVGERVAAYNDLQSDHAPLEILCTVDILNEGVDIPAVNMVLFLRPTDSSTIFIQQLGRGLRKYEGKDYVTVLDFIGNSYKRSVQIAFALSSLSENFVIEERLMKSLVREDFSALGLQNYGVEVNIDDLSKEEILNYIEKENFNSINYVKQDYQNFKKYIKAEYYPMHMDYLNSDVAPDLVRFMNIKIGGKKNDCYYSFLKGIGEDNLPVFSNRQIEFIKYLSKMLPLVRSYEYVIFKKLILDQGKTSLIEMKQYAIENIKIFEEPAYDHALKFIDDNKFACVNNTTINLNNVELNHDLIEYVNDLLDYGLGRFVTEFGDQSGFKLWETYRMDQVQMIRLINPKYTMLGTYFDDEKKEIYIFSTLDKSGLSEEQAMINYSDKFLTAKTFQWESKHSLSKVDYDRLTNYKKAFLFIRKVENEHGMQLPFIYVGTGEMSSYVPSPDKKGALIFNIELSENLPEDLQFDFRVPSLLI